MANTQYVIIGDVHGELDMLMEILNKAEALNRTPIFVGDLQDRGPKSKEVIEYIKSNNYLCVRGNHDQLMIDAHKWFTEIYENKNIQRNTDDIRQWCNGGGFEATMISYKLGANIQIAYGHRMILNEKEDTDFDTFTEHVEWLKSLPIYLELDLRINNRPVVISHSDISRTWKTITDEPLTKAQEDNIMWSRTEPKDVGLFNIFGHTPPGLKPIITDFYANIDTGCGKGGVLTGLLIPELQPI